MGVVTVTEYSLEFFGSPAPSIPERASKDHDIHVGEQEVFWGKVSQCTQYSGVVVVGYPKAWTGYFLWHDKFIEQKIHKGR